MAMVFILISPLHPNSSPSKAATKTHADIGVVILHSVLRQGYIISLLNSLVDRTN